MKLRKTTEQGVLTAIVPMGAREVPVGTFRSILKQARLTIDEFERILKSGSVGFKAEGFGKWVREATSIRVSETPLDRLRASEGRFFAALRMTRAGRGLALTQRRAQDDGSTSSP